MNNRIVLISTILGLSLSLHSYAADPVATEKQWSFSPTVGMNFEDTDRASNPGYTVGLGLGRQIAAHWSMELSLLGGIHDGYNELAQLGVGLDLLRTFGSSSSFSPYLLIGTGWMRTDVVEGPVFINRELEYDDPIISLGMGVLTPLGSSGNRFRGEVRYRADDKFSDLLTTIGLFRPFGASAMAAATLPDEDGDGIADDVDNCPSTVTGADVDRFGCALDTDGDGVTDVRDNCPGTPRGTSVDGRGCKGTETDSDGDGVPDHADVCSDTPRSVAVSSNGCERDEDRDWVVDSIDSCPNTPSGARVDIRGCEIGDKIELPGVMFELSSARLVATSVSILDQAAETLRRNPNVRVEAAGYTDTTGTPSTNLDLSQRRAEAVRQYLISKGANPANISARGYGQANPIADNSERWGRKRNRRVDLRILN